MKEIQDHSYLPTNKDHTNTGTVSWEFTKEPGVPSNRLMSMFTLKNVDVHIKDATRKHEHAVLYRLCGQMRPFFLNKKHKK